MSELTGPLPIIQRAPDGTQPLEARFWRKVHKTDSCWVWTGCRDRSGYGAIGTGGRTLKVHRYSYVLHFGAFDPDLSVCHRCDNRACVRPDHLFLGTPLENMQDCVAKGRHRGGRRSTRLRLPELMALLKAASAEVQR